MTIGQEAVTGVLYNKQKTRTSLTVAAVPSKAKFIAEAITAYVNSEKQTKYIWRFYEVITEVII
jgi:hypothetical protein